MRGFVRSQQVQRDKLNGRIEGANHADLQKIRFRKVIFYSVGDSLDNTSSLKVEYALEGSCSTAQNRSPKVAVGMKGMPTVRARLCATLGFG